MKNKYKLFALIICISVCLSAFMVLSDSMSTSQKNDINLHNFNGTRNDALYYNEDSNAAIIYEEELYVTGTLSTQHYGGDIFLHKYDKNGNIIWGRTWGIPGDMNHELALSILADNGEVYILGEYTVYINESLDSESRELLFLKYSINGELLRNSTWASNDLKSINYFIKYQNDLYITGMSSSYDILILKFDTNGNLLWNKTWERDNHTNLGVDIIAHNGTISVLGNSIGAASSDCDVIFLNYDLNGNLLWNKTYESEYYEVSDMKIMNGEIYVVGGSAKLAGFNGITSTTLFTFDLEGNLLRNKTIDDYDFRHIAGFDFLAGNLFLTGNRGSEFFIIKADIDGTIIDIETWELSVYSKMGGIISDGNFVYLFGSSFYLNDPNGRDMIFYKYNNGLGLVWNNTWGRNGSGYPLTESAIVNISMAKQQFTPDDPINVTITILNHGTENISHSGYCFTFILEHGGTSTELFCPYNATMGVIIPRGGVYVQTIDLREYSSDMDTLTEMGNLSLGDYSLRAVYGSQNNPWYNETDIPYDESTSNTLQFEVGQGGSSQIWVILITLIVASVIIIGYGLTKKRQKK